MNDIHTNSKLSLSSFVKYLRSTWFLIGWRKSMWPRNSRPTTISIVLFIGYFISKDFTIDFSRSTCCNRWSWFWCVTCLNKYLK